MYSNATYYLIPNSAGTAFQGSGYTPDGTIPSGAILCTQAQAENFQSYVPDSSGGYKSAPSSVLLKDAKTKQKTILKADCQKAILAGFTSSALGTAYNYPCDTVSQSNIDRCAISGGKLWCQDSNSQWNFTAHTATQAQQVQSDMHSHIQTQQSRYATDLNNVESATTVADVEAVTW